MKKGNFQHLAKTPAKQKYVGPYFPVDMYNPGQMLVKDLAVPLHLQMWFVSTRT